MDSSPLCYQGTIEATLSPGGLSCSSPSVYVIVVSGANNRAYYVGRTKTSNNTGISSPFKRLSNHLARRGNTHSMFWDTLNSLRQEWFAEATIKFVAIPIEDDDVVIAEAWLMGRFDPTQLLNVNINKRDVLICQPLASRLQRLLDRVMSPELVP